jgi:hypothetical protein
MSQAVRADRAPSKVLIAACACLATPPIIGRMQLMCSSPLLLQLSGAAACCFGVKTVD